MNNLLTAIYEKLSGSDLSNDVGGRMYLDEAPEGAQFPYVVFFIVSDIPENAFALDGESVIIQFSLYSTSQGATEITAMYTHLKSLYDDCSLSITDNRCAWFRRENMNSIVINTTTDIGTGILKHWAVRYQISTEVT